MLSLRIRRVSQLLKRAVGEIVRRDVNSPTSGLITIIDAEVAADLKTAKVYYSVIGSAAQQQNASSLLRKHRAHIQRQIARAIILKYTPVLEFIHDESIERGDRILRIISEIEAEQSVQVPSSTHEPQRPNRKKK